MSGHRLRVFQCSACCWIGRDAGVMRVVATLCSTSLSRSRRHFRETAMDEAKYAAKADEAATKGVCDPAVLPTEAIRTRADREGGDPARCAEGAAGKDRSRHSSASHARGHARAIEAGASNLLAHRRILKLRERRGAARELWLENAVDLAATGTKPRIVGNSCQTCWNK
jgi:hypothetical protein